MVGPMLLSRLTPPTGGGGGCCLATARAPLNSQSSSDVGGTSKGFGKKARGDGEVGERHKAEQEVSVGVPGRKLAPEMTPSKKNQTRLKMFVVDSFEEESSQFIVQKKLDKIPINLHI